MRGQTRRAPRSRRGRRRSWPAARSRRRRTRGLRRRRPEPRRGRRGRARARARVWLAASSGGCARARAPPWPSLLVGGCRCSCFGCSGGGRRWMEWNWKVRGLALLAVAEERGGSRWRMVKVGVIGHQRRLCCPLRIASSLIRARSQRPEKFTVRRVHTIVKIAEIWVDWLREKKYCSFTEKYC